MRTLIIIITAVALLGTTASFAEAQDAGWPVANGAPTEHGNLRLEHQFDTGWLWAGGGAFVAAYGAKIPAAALVFDHGSVYDAELGRSKRGCADATGALLLVPGIGGLLGLVSGYTCHHTGSSMNYSNPSAGYYVYERSAFDGDDEVAEAMAWVAFGVDLVGIVFTTIGLIGGEGYGWDDVSSFEVEGHQVSAHLGAPGADVGGVSLKLEL